MAVTTTEIDDLARIIASIGGIKERSHLVALILQWLKKHAPAGFKPSEFAALVEEFASRRAPGCSMTRSIISMERGTGHDPESEESGWHSHQRGVAQDHRRAGEIPVLHPRRCRHGRQAAWQTVRVRAVQASRDFQTSRTRHLPRCRRHAGRRQDTGRSQAEAEKTKARKAPPKKATKREIATPPAGEGGAS